MFHVILREGLLKIHFFLGSQNTNLLAYPIVPLEIAFGFILHLEWAFYWVLSIGNDSLDMGDYACLAYIMSTRPLVLILFKEDLILNIMDHDFTDHIQCYLLLFEDQHVSHDHVELRNLSIVG